MHSETAYHWACGLGWLTVSMSTTLSQQGCVSASSTESRFESESAFAIVSATASEFVSGWASWFDFGSAFLFGIGWASHPGFQSEFATDWGSSFD